MKRTVVFLGIACICGAAFAGGEIRMDAFGGWSWGDVSCRWVMASPGWTRTVSAGAETFSATSIVEGHVSGTIRAAGKEIRLTGELSAGKNGVQRWVGKLAAEDFPVMEHVSCEVRIPAGKAGRVFLNGKSVELPREFSRTALDWCSGNPCTVGIETGEGTLWIKGALFASLQDQRRWGDNFIFRISGLRSPPGKYAREYAAEMELSVTPVRCGTIDLSSSATTGFRDEVANDGAGGWTDQGVNNDLRMMTPGEKRFSGIRFRILDPAENGGKSCIVLSGASGKFPRESRIPVKSGRGYSHLYLLHAAAWVPRGGQPIGNVKVVYGNGETETFPVLAGRDCGNWWVGGGFENAAVAWEADGLESRVGLYASAFPLAGNVKEVVLTAEKGPVWMICALSLADRRVPFAVPSKQKLTVQAGKEWIPVEFSRRTLPGSPLDFSGALNAPAGKYGRIVAGADGHFSFENAPGKRIRFLGVNLCMGACFPEKEDAERMVREIAAVGYNAVRFHHFENLLLDRTSAGALRFNAEMLDRFQYFMSLLKKRGIYYTLDLYCSRKIRPEDGVRNWKSGYGPAQFKLLVPFEESAMRCWEAYAEKLLTLKNPHSGMSLADDPALSIVNLHNENGLPLLFHSENHPELIALCLERYYSWLRERELDTPANRKLRDSLFLDFLNSVQRKAIRRQTAFLRKTIGTRVLITDLNNQTGYSLNSLRREFDAVDNHTYWAHPTFPAAKWSTPTKYSQASPLALGGAHSREVMATRIFGKPFLLTEVNHCTPNRFTPEYAPLFGAYAALQDWDGIYRFAWSHGGRKYMERKALGGFDAVNNPLDQLSDRLVHALFVRGDVAPAPGAAGLLFREEQVKSLKGFAGEETRSFTWLGLYTKIGVFCGKTDSAASVGLDPFSNWAATLPGPLKQAYERALERKPVRSESGEILIAPSEKRFSVVTPRTEAVSCSGAAEGDVLCVRNAACPQSFALISLDGKALRESRSLLLLHLTETANSGMVFENASGTLLLDWGGAPVLLRKASADIVLRLTRGWKIETLDLSGRATGTVPVVHDSEGLKFRADTGMRKGGVMAYHLTR